MTKSGSMITFQKDVIKKTSIILKKYNHNTKIR